MAMSFRFAGIVPRWITVRRGRSRSPFVRKKRIGSAEKFLHDYPQVEQGLVALAHERRPVHGGADAGLQRRQFPDLGFGSGSVRHVVRQWTLLKEARRFAERTDHV